VGSEYMNNTKTLAKNKKPSISWVFTILKEN